MNDVLADPLGHLRDEIAERVDDGDLMAAVDKVHHGPERDALLHRALMDDANLAERAFPDKHAAYRAGVEFSQVLTEHRHSRD